MKTNTATVLLVACLTFTACGPELMPDLVTKHGVRIRKNGLGNGRGWELERINKLETDWLAFVNEHYGVFEVDEPLLDGMEVDLVPEIFDCPFANPEGKCEGQSWGDYAKVADLVHCVEASAYLHELLHNLQYRKYGSIDAQHTKPIWKSVNWMRSCRLNDNFEFGYGN